MRVIEVQPSVMVLRSIVIVERQTMFHNHRYRSLQMA